ncbi:MAG: hypothetical protein ACJ79A_08140 [Gemmatimonadaceae bacterium]
MLGAAATLSLAPTPSALPAQSAPSEALAAELFTGFAWSLRTPLVIELAGERRVIRARWSTRPFDDAPYYSYRVARASVGREIAAEMLHHKLYLENPVPPIDRLEVSHGYNEPMFDLATRGEGFRWRFGIGVVIAHPEGELAGRSIGPLRTLLGGGYHVAGISSQLAVGRRYPLNGGAVAMTASPELKLTAAIARIRIARGDLLVPNVALHALGGLGLRRRW